MRPSVAALLLLPALLSCAPATKAPPSPAVAVPAAALPAPAVLAAPTTAIVGHGGLVDSPSATADPRPVLLDGWLAAAGVARDEPRLAFAVTGNNSGVAVACGLEPERQRRFLEQAVARMRTDDPLGAPTRHLLGELDRLQGATFTLLSRPLSAEEQRLCGRAGVQLRQIVIGSMACGQGRCPVVLALNQARLAGTGLDRRLLLALIGPGGLAFDRDRLRPLGIEPLAGPELESLRAIGRGYAPG